MILNQMIIQSFYWNKFGFLRRKLRRSLCLWTEWSASDVLIIQNYDFEMWIRKEKAGKLNAGGIMGDDGGINNSCIIFSYFLLRFLGFTLSGFEEFFPFFYAGKHNPPMRLSRHSRGKCVRVGLKRKWPEAMSTKFRWRSHSSRA